MKAIRWSMAGLFLGLLVAGSARPAVAEFDENTNGCFGSASFRTAQFSVNADVVGVVTVPRSDTVDWQGSVAAPPGEYRGNLTLELPAIAKLFGASRISEIDTWEGNSQNMSNSGVEEYDLPSWLPGGVEFTVTGEHVDENGRCAGHVTMQVEGGAMKSPLTWVSLAGTIGTGAGMYFVARPLFRRVG